MNFSSLESNKVALLFVDKWTNLNIFGSYLNFFFSIYLKHIFSFGEFAVHINFFRRAYYNIDNQNTRD